MHASGIRVDDACSSAFARASADPAALFVRFTIASDRFVAAEELGPKRDTIEENWNEIKKNLSAAPNDPCFITARGVSSTPSKWLLLFYMPEGSTVRDRMVYAASVAALKDGLGQGNFESAVFSCNAPKDASKEEYESVSRQMNEEEILTLDEKLKLEGETQSAMAMSATKQRAIVGLPIKANEESLEALRAVQAGNPNTVILQLNADTEVLEVQQLADMTFEQIQSKLPANEPRYVLQNFAHEHDGKQVNAYVFCYYCPDDIKPKLKMFYSTCKAVVVRLMTENLSITPLAKSLELSLPGELSTPAVLDALYPKIDAKKTFKKPGRPGRGNARLITGDGSASSPSGFSSSPSP